MPRSSTTKDPRAGLLRISDLSRETGVPVATIKFYRREGLLPEPTLKTGRNMAFGVTSRAGVQYLLIIVLDGKKSGAVLSSWPEQKPIAKIAGREFEVLRNEDFTRLT